MPNKKSKISLTETGCFSKLFIDYIDGIKELQRFYTFAPAIDSFKKIIEDKSNKTAGRDVLVKVLQEQYAHLKNTKKQNTAFDLLLDKKTFTVCTGHQLCLFTGPLYFIYKIISTINLAASLKVKYPENNFVPVYWMASEDHDFEEISSIHLFNKKITWNNKEKKGAVGRMQTSSLQTVIDELKIVLGESEKAKELLNLFKTAYFDHSNLADAARYLVHELFGDYGLVILNPDDARLKSAFSEIVKDDILNNTNYKIVNQTIAELDRLNYKAQVNPRPINCFYLKDSLRERIELSNEGNYKVLNTSVSFSAEELAAELHEHPERFSPNVVLRPLYQQKVLPNIAYVGGPGEIAYWLEYKAMFDHHKITFPVLMPRNFAVIIDERSSAQISKLGLTAASLFKETEILIKEFIKNNSGEKLSLNAQEEKIAAVFNEISLKAMAVDAALKGTVEAELQKTINSLKNIGSKLLRAEKQHQETAVNQIKKIKDKFFPEGILQERYDNMAPFYLKSGSAFIEDLKNSFEPFEFEMLLLEDQRPR